MRGETWTSWAFEQPIPQAEKLVLVHLASQVNAVGVGLMDRELLEIATGYKKRSIQRLLKSLRDLHLLTDYDPWFLIGPAQGGIAPEVDAALQDAPPAPDPVTRMLDQARESTREAAVIDAEAIATVIGDKVIDAAEYLMDQLLAFEQRFAQQVDRMALLHVEREAAPPPPPPDPVLENPIYQQLLDMGHPPAKAYALSRADLELEVDYLEEPVPEMVHPPAAPVHRTDGAGRALGYMAPGGRYPDTPHGRLQRVADILAGEPTETTAPQLIIWESLEAAENKHSKEGEATAFELLYPAIVEAARRYCGRMTLAEFTDPKAVGECRAPWDLDPKPTPAEDATLAVEIAAMLGDLAATRDPRCEVQGRTTEKGDDGVVRQETMLGYHRRVKAKWNEMKKLQQMGAL